MKSCPECGGDVRDPHSFCPECGAPISSAARATAGHSTSSSGNDGSDSSSSEFLGLSNRDLLIYGGLLVVTLAAIAGVGLLVLQ